MGFFNDFFRFPRESSSRWLMAVDSVCPQGPTAVGKSDTAVELAKQLQLQGRKANGLRRSDDQLLTEILVRCG